MKHYQDYRRSRIRALRSIVFSIDYTDACDIEASGMGKLVGTRFLGWKEDRVRSRVGICKTGASSWRQFPENSDILRRVCSRQ